MVERVLETFYGSWPLTCGNFLVGKVDQCSGIKQNLHRAITELGKDFEVNVISDKAEWQITRKQRARQW